MSKYTVNKLAKLAGVSVRTLHHYDQIGLLQPNRNEDNGYRLYGSAELSRLQQIMFFKELEFSLEQIKDIIDAPNYDPIAALEEQKKILLAKRTRLNRLIKTIDQMITSAKGGEHKMDDKEIFESFSMEQMEQYQEEAKERWGNTDAYKQSQERTKHWTKADYKRIGEEGVKFTKSLADIFKAGANISDPAVQTWVEKHHAGIETFYDCPLEMYRNLGQMYVDDPRFTKYYDKHAEGLAVFVRDAITYYCDQHDKKKVTPPLHVIPRSLRRGNLCLSQR